MNIPFVFRFTTLFLRFSIPLVILIYLTGGELGKYYLYTATATTIIFFISLEVAVPTSRIYLRAWKSRTKKSIFTNLQNTQLVQSFVLSTPIVILAGILLGFSKPMIFFAIIYLTTEATVNESGRFFWNTNNVKIASTRDFFRALFFAIGLATSVYIERTAISVISLSLMSFFNVLILIHENREWGQRVSSIVNLKKLSLFVFRKFLYRIVRMIRLAAPQVAHLQILSILPLLERSFLERTIGLEAVGLYSFQYSLIQAGFALLLLPSIAHLRRSILATRTSAERQKVCKDAANFSLKALLVGLICTMGGALALPLLNFLLHKHYETTFSVMMAVWLSASASIYTGAVATLFGSRIRVVQANVQTILATTPILLGFLTLAIYGNVLASYVFTILSFAAVLQIAIRYKFFSNRIRPLE
jgi:hypothetical protein